MWTTILLWSLMLIAVWLFGFVCGAAWKGAATRLTRD